MNAQAKTINLLLYNGSLNGVISIEDSSWNAGELYSAPRASVSELLSTDACNKYGVYLLLSSNMVYVGQSSDLAKRLNQHIIKKDWWERAVILTTKDDSLNHSDIDYLENILIEKADELERWDCENKKKGNPPKVDKFRKVYLKQYLDEALFLMQLIGINVFNDENKPASRKGAAIQISSIDTHTRLAIGKRAKAEAIQFVKNAGYSLEKNVSYAVRQDNSGYFWINPQASMLNHDWSVILNNTVKNELVVLRIPAYSLKLISDNEKGVKTRTDKKELLDLKIETANLTDLVSGTVFSDFVVAKLVY